MRCAIGAWTCRRPMPARPSPHSGRRKRALSPNSLMPRRTLLGAALSLAATSAFADDKPLKERGVPFSVPGALTQGSLAMGSAPPGSLVALDGRPLRVPADGRFAFGFG